jgi:MarR family transcriptional regulator, negative regulator of the multidrug operon emrRAB
MLSAHMDHDLNVVGALVVALGDRVRDATESATGMGGALPAALVSLREWAGGRTVDTLAGGLRLSHSRTVRVIDRLEAEGLASRERDPADGRSVLVRLTPAGERAAAAALSARDAALTAALQGLGPRDRRRLAELSGRVLAELTSGRRSAGANCRLCDSHACGHHEGRCPVTRAANAAEAAA